MVGQMMDIEVTERFGYSLRGQIPVVDEVALG